MEKFLIQIYKNLIFRPFCPFLPHFLDTFWTLFGHFLDNFKAIFLWSIDDPPLLLQTLKEKRELVSP